MMDAAGLEACRQFLVHLDLCVRVLAVDLDASDRRQAAELFAEGAVDLWELVELVAGELSDEIGEEAERQLEVFEAVAETGAPPVGVVPLELENDTMLWWPILSSGLRGAVLLARASDDPEARSVIARYWLELFDDADLLREEHDQVAHEQLAALLDDRSVLLGYAGTKPC